MSRNICVSAMAAGLALSLVCTVASATSVQTASGLSSAGVPVSVQAELTISGDILTVKLSNTSTSTSLNPADLLCSYYFDIINGVGDRPDLQMLSAEGDVWLTSKDLADVLTQADADLVAVNKKDGTWQFISLDGTAAPYLGFGVGTVGNSALSGSNFDGSIVGGMDYAIYAGDITTRNLDDRFLVNDSILFTFSGASGFTEQDISDNYAFGLGTAPDLLFTGGDTPGPPAVPEPLTMALFGLGVVGMGRYVRRRVSAA